MYIIKGAVTANTRSVMKCVYGKTKYKDVQCTIFFAKES